MFYNYLKIAFRSLARNSVYSFINIVGLSIGITCSILILLWVADELTFDTYFSKYDTIYQVKQNSKVDSGISTRPFIPLPLFEILQQQDSRIKNAAITINQTALLTVGDRKITKNGLDVSESFLKIFDFQMIYGDLETALTHPRSIVLTQSTAKALFGTDDALGKMVQVKIENDEELKVTGIIADPPSNISFRVDFLLPFAYFEATSVWIQHAKNNWNNNAFFTYVELQPGVDKADVDSAIRDLIKKNNPEGSEREIFLHGMNRWRLHNNFENGKESGGLITYVQLFSGIAIFILIIACINFMNLATARSEHRAREVGIRKSVGSNRKQLILQFLGESIMISTIAFIFSIVLVELALPLYNTFINKHLAINYTSPLLWSLGIGLVLVTGLLAGSYPAFYLSSFKPVKVLKGKLVAGKNASVPRQVMGTLQFGFSILLIIGTIVIYKQIQYLKGRELGYDRENLMMIWSTSDIEKNFTPLKQELVNTGAAISVCKSNSPITNIFASSPVDSWPGMSPGQRVEVTNIATEYDYTKTMGIRMLQGRDFSENFKSDTAAIILNKTAVETLNLNEPIGQTIQMWGSQWNIIGVMDDVLMGSGSTQIGPLVMTMDPTWSSTITVRLPKHSPGESNNLAASLKKVEDVFKKYNPDYPFEYRFADEEFEKKFTSMNMISDLASSFTVLAIFITCLGLFGMAAFSAEQRTKEIGIRKVMGASVASLMILLTKDFSRLVIIAFVIATPIAWYATTDFLKQYPIRIEVPLWVFPLAGIVALVLTILIVSTQALRAARANPTDSLRSE
ncbi:MAG: ABC transporter permease [Cyclobacteriaceae bacterium]|nr:ABC transporter permease [Cyclobacteriaceae bacterium]